MDADGSGFSFPTSSDYQKGQDASDVSWADIFLDGIHSDDPGAPETVGVGADTSSISVHSGTQQLLQQSQSSVLGGQLQIHIPTHLQGSLTSNGIQQAGTNLCGTVAYLAPAVSNQQQVGTAGRIQSVVAVAGQHQVAATVGQQQHQGSAKLVQIASSFPVASVQQLTSSVPIQTLLPNQTITGQTIYGSQSAGLFPAQGSVHIENPKVVNVNFGPHVIGSDGSGQQAIIQTAEGKSVLITNSQLQHLPQSISLTQPLVGAQLISSAGGSVIRAGVTSATHTLMPATGAGTQQIVIPRQTSATQGGITKNVVLRPLNANMSPVIYQSGQTGSLIHSQATLIASSGTGLQVVNTGRSQGGQVQLITQPSISQTGIGHQQLMNLLSNQAIIPNTGNQITGLMPGQNIVVNGQVLNISQIGGLTVPQLQLQHNPQSGVTLAAHFQPTTQQVIIQHNGQQQQQVLQQPKSTQSPSFVANILPSQRLTSGLPGSKSAPTLTSYINSCSSTPTPSTPTPSQTPDIMSDSCDTGGKGSQSINILEQALALSAIDLQSLGDDINFLDSMDCFPSVTTPPASIVPLPPVSKQKTQPVRTKSKTSKLKPKTIQPVVNVTVNSNSVQIQQPTTQFHNAQGQKVTISPQQKIITANGQVFVLSANGQQFILQPSPNSSTAAVSTVKSEAIMTSAKGIVSTVGISIPPDSKMPIKDLNQQTLVHSSFASNVDRQLKVNPGNISVSAQQMHMPITSVAQSDKMFIKTTFDSSGHVKTETAVQSAPAAAATFTTVTTVHNSPSLVSPFQTSTSFSETLDLQMKNQKITTLSGTFLKQEPLEQVKEEPVMDMEQCVSQAQDVPSVSMPMTNLFHTSLTTTTSTVIAMSTPLVSSSASFTAMTTTQSHHTTIMSTAQAKASWQTSVSTASSHLPCSSVLDDRCLDTICQSQVTPTFMQSVASTAATAVSTPPNLKSNSKEKDPANIKSMIPIKIADSTVMLSLTPGQKERLENQLSHMSKKDQEEFLVHQQNIIRRTQQVQQKQLEQQKKLIQQQQLQQKVQQQHCQLPEEFQQLERAEQARQTPKLQLPYLQHQQPSQQTQQQHQSQAPLQQQQQQQQTQQVYLQQTHPPATNSSPQISRPESTASPAGHAVKEFPTTVQELLDQSEELDTQQHCQQYTVLKPLEQLFVEQTQLSASHQQQQQQQQHQQHVHQNLQKRTVVIENRAGTIHSFILPQLGRCLAEQQLLRDRSLAISPDVNTPFKSLSDAMRRLVRYHTLQDHKPEENSSTMQMWDTRYSKLCDYLVKTKRCYLRRFSKVQLYHDMCPNKQPEYIQNLMCFNEQLRELIDSEKERAKNQPDLFEPINPAYSSFHQSSSEASCRSSVEDPVDEENELVESSEDCEPEVAQLAYYGQKEPYTDDNSGSEKADLPHVSPIASPPRQKRKLCETGSSGTLKLVLKRRTTDNFIVKKSSADVYELPEELKPSINVDKSDSEYEYDSQTAGVACNQPVIIRRRMSSMSSRLTSSEAASDNSSFSSQADKIQDHSSVEDNSDEEIDENNEDDDEESDEGEEIEKSSVDENEVVQQFIGHKECASDKYSVSGSDELPNNEIDNDVSCNVSTDAFMENDEIMESVEALNRYSMNAVEFSGGSVVRLPEESGASLDSPHSGKNSSASMTSEDVFHSSLSYPHTDSPQAKDQLKYHVFSDEKSTGASTVAVQGPAVGVSGLFGQSCRTLPFSQDEEYMSESSVSSIKKETSTKGPLSSSLFITPHKNLLETDAMFNSDDDDNDELSGDRRSVSSFKIDNKDPQSSMINDSVRSAINSVLDGGDDDDDDDNKDSQTSWASTANRLPLSSSSSSIHNLFHSSLSSSHVHSHDADLDAAVQSILNS